MKFGPRSESWSQHIHEPNLWLFLYFAEYIIEKTYSATGIILTLTFWLSEQGTLW